MPELFCPTDFEDLIYRRIPPVGLEVVICIHSTVLGPALGGTRFKAYASREEAEVDCMRLGNGMTNKCAMIWPDYKLGGGKAVIIGDPKKLKTPQLLRAFGKVVQSLNGNFITGEDMNITPADVEEMSKTCKFVVGRSRAQGGSGNPAEYTAMGCIAGQRAAMQKVFKSRKFEGRTLVFQGAGEVGFRHARLVAELGAKIFASEVDPEKTDRIKKEVGAEIVDDVFSVDCDIFVPSAVGGILNDQTIPLLRCKIVAGCANNQLADPKRHGLMLMERGIVYVPDYVINAGGLTAVADEMMIDGFNRSRVDANVEKIYNRVWGILERAEIESKPPHEVADEICAKRVALVKEANELTL